MTDNQTPPDPAPTHATYTVFSSEVWEQARRDYVEGEPASVVCERYGLARFTFHSRAAREGWRRKDQPAVERTPYITIQGAEIEPTKTDVVEMARLRMIHAIGHGSAAEALGWFRYMLAMDRDGHLLNLDMS